MILIDGMPIYNTFATDKGVLCKGSVTGTVVLYPDGRWEEYDPSRHGSDIKAEKVYVCVLLNGNEKQIPGSEIPKYGRGIVAIKSWADRSRLLDPQGVYWVRLNNGIRVVINKLLLRSNGDTYLYDEYGKCLSAPNDSTLLDVEEVLLWPYGVVYNGIVRHESGYYKLSDKLGV